MVRLDSNGIPILSRAEIELRAERFLGFFDEECLKEPLSTPLRDMSRRLQDEFGLRFVFNAQLGKSPEGYGYRGRFHIRSRTILVDQSLPPGEPRFNFTLAHEMAHFVLHRNVKQSVLTTEKDLEISDTARDLVLDHLESDNPRTWLEWQANKFASSLLLPRFTTPKGVIQKQRELGIIRNVGTIFLDRQRRNYQDFREILRHLERVFNVSQAAIRIRLRELNLLIETELDDRREGSEPEPIRDVLGRAIELLDEE
jgi:Zn-dependent peptidase ImmA (M78 family)